MLLLLRSLLGRVRRRHARVGVPLVPSKEVALSGQAQLLDEAAVVLLSRLIAQIDLQSESRLQVPEV